MWWSYVVNMAMAFVMVVTMLYCIGPLEGILDADLPYLNLFSNTGSTSAALFLAIILLLLVYAGNITALATTSREVWAFSRDRGFPFSTWISHVSSLIKLCIRNEICTGHANEIVQLDKKHNLPFNAIYLSTIISIILALISLGSSLAFTIITSLSLLALMSTYALSIGCVLYRRVRCPETLPHARWSLGRWGLPVNLLAVVYSTFIVLLSCFPYDQAPALADANWAPLIWVAVILGSVVTYVLHGRREFTPPVMFVEGRRGAGVEVQKVA